MKPRKVAALCGLSLVVLLSPGCSKWLNKLKARDQLNKGVGAFRNAQFQAAIDHFQTAVALDPMLLPARLYLATAYAQQYIPGGESKENLKIANQAINSFEDALKMDSNNTTAIASIAQIYYQMNNFDKAKEYQRRRLEIEPQNQEPYYWIGVIDWAVCYRQNGQIRTDLKLNIPDSKGDLPKLPEKSRAELEKTCGSLVEEGLNALKKAIEIKPNDFDTMAYLNLTYRQKADIEKDPSSRQADLKTADEWQQKALNLRKQGTATTAAETK